ncbi:MAG: hypothetical protein WC002_03625 [Candidatus Muiribacteriota bacterium]
MKTFVFNNELKNIAESFYMGMFSEKIEKSLFIEQYKVNMVDINSDKMIFFPEFFIENDIENSLNKKFDYALLPDHGIEDSYNSNIYSQNRKGRLHFGIGCPDKKECVHDCIMKKLPFKKREIDDINFDHDVLKMKYFIKDFVLYFAGKNQPEINLSDVTVTRYPVCKIK